MISGLLCGETSLPHDAGRRTNPTYDIPSCNDLALIRIKQEKKGNPIYGTKVRDKGRLGGDQVCGVPVRTAHDAVELRRALEAAFAADGPVIVDSHEYDEVVLKKDKP
jgi:acetolactate synthase-1/2/3 large subunit